MSNTLINENSLIVLVQQNDLLYNETNKDYKNKQKKKEVWEAIGLEVGASGDACYKRWSSLRDRYCREVRRMACRSGSGAITETKWQHYESLSFLSGHMRGARRQRSNISFETEEVLFPPWKCLEVSELVTASTPLPSPVSAPVGFTDSLSSSSSQTQKRRREVAHDEQSAALLEVCKSMKSFLEKKDSPQDMRAHSFGKFVESCLTGMEQKKQMKVIGDIMQLLIAAQNEN